MIKPGYASDIGSAFSESSERIKNITDDVHVHVHVQNISKLTRFFTYYQAGEIFMRKKAKSFR